jgi:hypothetical protein
LAGSAGDADKIAANAKDADRVLMGWPVLSQRKGGFRRPRGSENRGSPTPSTASGPWGPTFSAIPGLLLLESSKQRKRLLRVARLLWAPEVVVEIQLVLGAAMELLSRIERQGALVKAAA